MAIRRKADDAASRVRHLIALDAWNVMRRLRSRHAEMVALFSRLRDRGPLLGTIHSWFHSISFGEMASLDPAEQLSVNQFYELLGEVRWYLQYTEDMPLQVQKQMTHYLRDLETRHRRLTEVIGPPDAGGSRVVDGTVVEKAGGSGAAVVSVRARRRR